MSFNVYTVRGRERYDGDILVCNTLRFVRAIFPPNDSKLVIVPKPSSSTEPRVLKIIAKKIDLTGAVDPSTHTCVAEITYDLDGDILRTLDPENAAKAGNKGANGDNGDPHYGLGGIMGTCGYPVGKNGGDAEHGERGSTGDRGQNGPILEIWVDEVDGEGLTIDLRGQQGGKGGKGGNGGKGGKGENGCNATAGTGETWLGVPTAECVQEPGAGGDGGDGGNAGWGGDGGDGGNGGVVKIFYTATGGANFTTWNFQLDGGKGGDPGDHGNPGDGGNPGLSGSKLVVCPDASDGNPGNKGMTVKEMENREGEPQSEPGNPGADGFKNLRQIQELPSFP